MPDDLPAGQAVGFDALDGFAADDLASAFAAFRATASTLVDDPPALRPARPSAPGLRACAAAALGLPPVLGRHAARGFFERHFTPRLIRTDAGEDAFLTGYYEPVVEGARVPSEAFCAPLLARPADLRTLGAGEPGPPGAETFTAARVGPGGELQPYPDRAAIEAAIPSGAYEPLVWLRDWAEVFLVHVQGSARVALPDGTALRLTYAGRNGHPYTSIGRLLAERGEIAPGAMALDWLKAWVRAHGQKQGDEGRALLDRNASYIFFSAAPVTDGRGPTGGAGVPLTALRSIAVDRSRWCYGLPFWVDAVLPWQGVSPSPFRRLMIAQDTGSAIVGPARADLFFGSGPEAGHRAGDIRHRGRFTVLVPRMPKGGA